MDSEKISVVEGGDLQQVAAQALEKLSQTSREPVIIDVAEIEARVAANAVPDLGLLKAVEEFDQSFRDRSFSGRNPELGKMIKCVVCDRRHRSSEVCVQRFAKFDDDSPRTAPVPRFLHQPANPYGWRKKLDPRLNLFLNRLNRAQAHL